MIATSVIVETVISYFASFKPWTSFGAIGWDKVIVLENP